MSAHPAPRATRSIRVETAGSSGLALGPNQRGKRGGEVEASTPVMAMATSASEMAYAGEPILLDAGRSCHASASSSAHRSGVGGLPSQSGLDRGDVDFRHRHHCVEGALGRCGVAAGGGFEQDTRCDLPGKAPPILAPAAGALLAAAVDDRVPVAVGLFLILGHQHEAHRFVGPEIRAAVETDELLAEHGELDGQFVTFFATWKVRRCLVAVADVTVGKDGGVEIRCLTSLPVVEP